MAGRSAARVMMTSVVLALFGGQGCGDATSSTGRAQAQEIVARRQAVVEEAQRKREGRVAELRSLDVVPLARELAIDSQKGREPFNSLAFTEMVSRGESAALRLAPLITAADRSSLLGLLALKRISPKAYQQLDTTLRVNVLIDALRTSPSFNTWGLPHLRWEDAARAIIDEGASAEGPLRAMLKDKRDAPVWGGEDAAEYRRYRYRVCDYAWALLNEIGGRVVTIPENPAERDVLQMGLKP